MEKTRNEKLNSTYCINESKLEEMSDISGLSFINNNINRDLINLGKDTDCPLNFPMVQQCLDEYNYKIQNQQNELSFIRSNINRVNSIIGGINVENEILKSIINKFEENYKIKNKMQSNLNSNEIQKSNQNINSTIVEFIQYETKLTEDVTNVSQCVEKIKSLKKMSQNLKNQINSTPATGSDLIIDLLESDIENLANRNKKIRERYIDLIKQNQDAIDELRLKLDSIPDPYLFKYKNVPPNFRKVVKIRRIKKKI